MTIRRSTMPIVATIFLSSAVFGEDINCQSEYGSVKLKGNVVVAAPCTLNGTEVDGNIRIFAGGSLIAIGAVIDGNIKADTADFIDLQNTEVGGNVELDELVGDVSFIGDSTIDGDIKLDKNRSRLLLLRNYVADNLEVIRNGGGVVISDNVIDGDLLCEKNSPSPEGSNNMVSGKTKNQCRNLQAAPDTVSSGDDSEPSGGSVSDGGSETPPFEIITGTGGGGGGSVGPLLILFLLVVGVVRSRRYGSQYHKYSSTAL